MKAVTQMGIGHVLRGEGKRVVRSQAGPVTLPLVNGKCLTNITVQRKQKSGAAGAARGTANGYQQVTPTVSGVSAKNSKVCVRPYNFTPDGGSEIFIF